MVIQVWLRHINAKLLLLEIEVDGASQKRSVKVRERFEDYNASTPLLAVFEFVL